VVLDRIMSSLKELLAVWSPDASLIAVPLLLYYSQA